MNGLLAPADATGGLPDWETTDYACDDPAFAADPSPWVGHEDREEAVCSRSPLARSRTSTADACHVATVAEPDVEGRLFGFLEVKLRG